MSKSIATIGKQSAFYIRRKWQDNMARKIGYKDAMDCLTDFDCSRLSPPSHYTEKELEEIALLVSCHATDLVSNAGRNSRYEYSVRKKTTAEPDYMKDMRERNERKRSEERKANRAAQKLGYKNAFTYKFTSSEKRKPPHGMSTEEAYILNMTVMTDGRWDPTDYIKEKEEERRLKEKYKDKLIPQKGLVEEPERYLDQCILKHTYYDVIMLGPDNLSDKSYLHYVKLNDDMILDIKNDDIYGHDSIVGHFPKLGNLGYIEHGSDVYKAVFNQMKRKLPVNARVSKVEENNFYLNIYLYEPLDKIFSVSRTFKVLSSNNIKFRENNCELNADHEVYFDYDPDKGIYLVTCHYKRYYSSLLGDEMRELGYVSKSIEKIIDNNDYVAIVSKSNKDKNDRWNVEITLYFDKTNESGLKN